MEAKKTAKERRKEKGIRQVMVEITPGIHFDLDVFEKLSSKENRSTSGQIRYLMNQWIQEKTSQERHIDIQKRKQNIAMQLVAMRKKVKNHCQDCGTEFKAIKIAKYCPKCGNNANRCAAYRKRRAERSN